jgi:hypothetical protein
MFASGSNEISAADFQVQKLPLSKRHALASKSPYLAELSADHADVLAYSSAPLPYSFWALRHEEHSHWQALALMGMFRAEPFWDPSTGVLYGGPHGARWMVLPLIRMLNALCNPPDLSPLLHRGPFMCVELIRGYIQECVDIAVNLLRRSAKHLQHRTVHRLNIRDTPLILEPEERSDSRRPLSPYNPRSHAAMLSYEELYI